MATLLALIAPLVGAAASLDFDRVFNGRGGSMQSHYVATYRLADGMHQVEVWRDHDVRVKRRTDDAIETFIFKPSGAIEWSMTVLDLKRRIRTDVDRTNLYRIGHFTDWFALAHSLTRPVGNYSLQALQHGRAPESVPLAACRWYALVRDARTSNICWSGTQRAPLVITDGEGAVQWQVTAIDSRPLAPAIFAIDAPGFVRNDANRDIQAD